MLDGGEPHDDEPQREPLWMWTIYDHPRDFPSCYVARKYAIHSRGVTAHDTIMVCADLERLRQQMREKGLTCLHRSPEDDAKIVESWV